LHDTDAKSKAYKFASKEGAEIVATFVMEEYDYDAIILIN
jgi:hypothetical protein